MTASTPEHESNAGMPVPVYDSSHQISVDSDSERGNYQDPELYAISVERTRVLREITMVSGIPANAVGGLGLNWALEHTDSTVGRNFDAHGIAKGDPIEALDEIMKNGIQQQGRTLYTMPFSMAGAYLEAFGADHPKTEGGIILVSEPEKLLASAGIKYVLVGEEYINSVDLLRNRYTNVQIIPWHDIPKILTEDYNQVFGTNLQYMQLTSENKPSYPLKGPREKKIPTEIPGVSTKTNENVEDVW